MGLFSRLMLAAAATVDPKEAQLLGSAEFLAAAADEQGKPNLRKFHMLAYNGGAMQFYWSDDPVVIDLAGLDAGKPRPALRDHDRTQIVGHTQAIINDGKTLSADGLVSGGGQCAQDVISAADNGFPWQCSVGVRMLSVEHVKAGGNVTVNGRDFAGPVVVVRKGLLGEISFVALGADDETSASLVAGAVGQNKPSSTKGNDMSFTEWLKAQGFDPATLSDTQQATLQAAYDAGPGKTEPAPVTPPASADPVQEMRAAAATEATRLGSIQQLCAGNAEIQAKAIAEGWDSTKTELEMLRASRVGAPNINTGHGAPAGAAVLEAGAAISLGLDTAAIKPEILDAADQRFRGQMGLQQLLLEAAWANGYHGHNFRADIRGVLQAAFSSRSISDILSNLANKSLLASYMAVEQAWKAISSIANVSDFKTHTRLRLTGDSQYEKLLPGGEIKHGTLTEDKFTIKADTYAKMFGIERSDLINDDLGALSGVPRRLGRGAGLALNDLFWTVFMANSSFFTSGNKNYISGSGTTMTSAGLTEADLTLRNQTDHEGKPLGLSGSILLVPNALRIAALALVNSIEVRDTTASTKIGTANPFAGAFNVVASAYLGNASYTGNSVLAWYLLMNPADIPTIEVAFLNGQEAPTIESADADFNRLGIQMRGYHDFGVALQDPRGGVKSKGAA